MTVSITRQDQDAAALRYQAGRNSDARLARRLLAVSLILDGEGRLDTAVVCGMDRQTLRDWVHRANAEGVAGLRDRARGGGVVARPAAAQETAIAGRIEPGDRRRQHRRDQGKETQHGWHRRKPGRQGCHRHRRGVAPG